MQTWQVHCGDALSVLKTLPDGCVDCVVTSPPYWGLRNYGHDGQLGLEPSPGEYVAAMVAVMAECRRVLRDDGTLWLNLGSSYAASVSRDSDPSQSLSSSHAPACDSDGITLQGSLGSGSSYPDLCDECRAVFLSSGTVGSGLPTERSALLLEPTSRDTGPKDYVSAFAGVSPLDVHASTTRLSFGLPLDGCSHCANCAACLKVLRSSSRDGSLCARREQCSVGSDHNGSDSRNQDKDASGTAWLNYTYKPKDLVPIPWLVAMALQRDGWYLRSEIIWHKKSCMPESVKDRPTKAHEQVFLLTKQPKYFYDADAIREKYAESTLEQIEAGYDGKGQKDYASAGVQNPSGVKARIVSSLKNRRDLGGTDGYVDLGMSRGRAGDPINGANARSVWSLGPEPATDIEHFAVMPKTLARRCVLAGCPFGGTVLDPFAGSGTTLIVALEEGRNAIGIELNPAYLAIARSRLGNTAPLLAQEIRI